MAISNDAMQRIDLCLSSLVMIKALKALQLFDVIIRKLVRQNVLLVNISKLRLSSHRICIDTARWARPQALPLYRRTCAQFFREGISDIMVMDFFYKKIFNSIILLEKSKYTISAKIYRINNENDTKFRKLSSIFVDKAFNECVWSFEVSRSLYYS